MVLYISAEGEDGYDQSLSAIVQESYSASLANHHTWAIRKAVGLAARALPYKDTFIERIASTQPRGPCTIEKCKTEILHVSIPAMRRVYENVQSFYESKNLLSLP